MLPPITQETPRVLEVLVLGTQIKAKQVIYFITILQLLIPVFWLYIHSSFWIFLFWLWFFSWFFWALQIYIILFAKIHFLSSLPIFLLLSFYKSVLLEMGQQMTAYWLNPAHPFFLQSSPGSQPHVFIYILSMAFPLQLSNFHRDNMA